MEEILGSVPRRNEPRSLKDHDLEQRSGTCHEAEGPHIVRDRANMCWSRNDAWTGARRPLVND
jgi:hypothetical protein